MLDNSSQIYSNGSQIHPPLISIFIAMSALVIIQAIMLSSVLRCRQYISLKLNHEMELKVAEKSVSKKM